MVNPSLYVLLRFTFFLLILHFLFSQASKNPNLEPLLAFKVCTDKANKLTIWNSTTNPCTWTGVSCLHDQVSRLVLEDFDLQGSFESLTALILLRVLSLKPNRLSGPIPDLSNLTALKLLFLSHNDFFDEFSLLMPTHFRLTVSICRTIIFLARFQYQSTVWPTSWRSCSRRIGFPVLFPIWTSRICRTSTLTRFIYLFSHIKKNIFDNKGFSTDIVFGRQQNNDRVCVLVCSYSK